MIATDTLDTLVLALFVRHWPLILVSLLVGAALANPRYTWQLARLCYYRLRYAWLLRVKEPLSVRRMRRASDECDEAMKRLEAAIKDWKPSK